MLGGGAGGGTLALGSLECSQELGQQELAHVWLADGLGSFTSPIMSSASGSRGVQAVKAALKMRKWRLIEVGGPLQVTTLSRGIWDCSDMAALEPMLTPGMRECHLFRNSPIGLSQGLGKSP